jgi:hypothetical protein
MRPVDQVVEHFPERRAMVRRLYLKDEQFRSICEDFGLSTDSLRRFVLRPDAHLRPEIDDYRALLRELEQEIRHYLTVAGSV